MNNLFVSLRRIFFPKHLICRMKFYTKIFYVFLLINLLSSISLVAQQDSLFYRIISFGGDNYIIHAFNYDSCFLNAYTYTGDTADIQLQLNPSGINDSDPYGDDSFISNIYVPFENLGSLPNDICINHEYNKYYIYGGRKLLIFDLSSNDLIDDIVVSDIGSINRHSSRPLFGNEKKLIYIQESDRLFCATDGGELLVVNGQNNEVIEGSGYIGPNENSFYTSIYLDKTYNTIFFITVSEDEALVSKVIVFDMEGNQLTQLQILGERISDISTDTYCSNVVITTTWFDTELDQLVGRIRSYIYYNEEFTNPISLPVSFAPQTIAFIPAFTENPDRFLIGYYENVDRKLVLYNHYNGSISDYIDNPYMDMSFKMIYDDTEKKAYCSGMISIEGSGGGYYVWKERIIKIDLINNIVVDDIESPEEIYKSSGYITMISDGNDLYSGLSDMIQTINSTNFEVLGVSDLNGSHCDKLEFDNSTEILYSANTIDGNIITTDVSNKADPVLEEIILTGGTTWSGCYNPKNNKIYFIQNGAENYIYSSFSNHSAVYIVDGSDDQILTSIPVGSNLMSCVYNYKSNKIFVSCLNDDEVIIIDGETNSLESETITINKPKHLYSGYDGKVYCTGSVNSSYSIHVIDTDNSYQTTSFSTPRSVTKMIHDGDETLYIIYGESNHPYGYVRAVNTETYVMSDEIKVGVKPVDIKYDAGNNELFTISYVDSTLDIITIHGWNNYSKKSINIGSKPRYLEYRNSPTEDKLYIVFEEGISIYSLNTGISDPIAFQTDAILYNPFNDRLYVKTSYNEEENYSGVIRVFECTNDDEVSLIDLDQRNIPGILVIPSYKINMALNTTDNKIYLGNGPFSNVSAIQCAPETRTLNSDINWLSFPRLEREGNNGVDAQAFLLNNLSPFPSDYLSISHLLQPDEDLTSLEYSFYGGWDEQGLSEIISDRGYILEFSNDDPRIVTCEGTILDAAHQVNLYGPNKYNWVGYFLPETQDVFDAIPQTVLDNLNVIQAQDWACVKYYFNGSDGSTDSCWMCSDRKPLEYGDMLKLKPYSNTTMQWHRYGIAPSRGDIPKSEHFGYDELTAYTPIYIEMDSTENPAEIGAFVGDSCIGATVVGESDTLVLVRTYTNDTTGQEILFETWYDSLKSAPARISEYYTYNHHTLRKEKRAIYTGNMADYYLVSFNGNENIIEPASPEPNISIQSIRPNPFSETTEITYALLSCANTMISILTLDGQQIYQISQGTQCNGTYTVNWDGTTYTGEKAGNGIYLLCIEAGMEKAIEKLVYIKQ